MNNPQQRKGMYAKIAIARKQLALDDDTYREKLRNEYGVDSAKDLTDVQLSRLVQSFAALGATFTSKSGGNKNDDRRVIPHSRPDWVEITDFVPFAAQKKQIAAIWKKLGYSMNKLNTRVEKAFGVPVFVWMQDEKQLSTLLSDLQRREKSFDKKSLKPTAVASGSELIAKTVGVGELASPSITPPPKRVKIVGAEVVDCKPTAKPPPLRHCYRR